jgi:hypothetical protein
MFSCVEFVNKKHTHMYVIVDRTYGVLNGPQREPRWTNIPPGPHPARKERPMDRPASTIASSLPVTEDAQLSTRAYFRDGR